ncbi:hypothetical protein [Flavobacterium sp. I3-2]|uniref:hypothetical protein n=1 Tax=Flavobacterium sp. I3-2 TaxID=2748319 RepID=UPI002107925C|nr:hypothetical protein [Flavobacterium sp. I3-2]
MMKMCELTLESYYWTEDKVECPYELLVLLKEQANMGYFHQQLNNYCLYSLSHVMYDKKRVSEVIYDAIVFQSIIKITYKIFQNPEEFKIRNLCKHQVSEKQLQEVKYLDKKEIENPYLVFENIFKKHTFENVSKSFLNLILATMADDTYRKDFDCSV